MKNLSWRAVRIIFLLFLCWFICTSTISAQSNRVSTNFIAMEMIVGNVQRTDSVFFDFTVTHNDTTWTIYESYQYVNLYGGTGEADALIFVSTPTKLGFVLRDGGFFECFDEEDADGKRALLPRLHQTSELFKSPTTPWNARRVVCIGSNIELRLFSPEVSNAPNIPNTLGMLTLCNGSFKDTTNLKFVGFQFNPQTSEEWHYYSVLSDRGTLRVQLIVYQDGAQIALYTTNDLNAKGQIIEGSNVLRFLAPHDSWGQTVHRTVKNVRGESLELALYFRDPE